LQGVVLRQGEGQTIHKSQKFVPFPPNLIRLKNRQPIPNRLIDAPRPRPIHKINSIAHFAALEFGVKFG
jgi:hypothetical protein